MQFARSGGILLHPTSFPGPYGIGDLGVEAYRFVDFLQQTGQRLWQILPLAPTGYGDSPYAALSAFAGNPLLISPDILHSQALLSETDLAGKPEFPDERVDYGRVIDWKMALLQQSFERFKQRAGDHARSRLAEFEQENAAWLEDFALFMAAKGAHDGVVWNQWDEDLALRRPAALARWREKLSGEIAFQKYTQFLFFQQWLNLKQYANERGIHIIGDIPIFVAYDSADVWQHPELFYLDAHGNPTLIAGVPPDYFSPTGQRWGNPLYRWNVMAQNDYAWWVARFRSIYKVVDIVRLDHFRGFEAFWEVPASEETAVNGRWVKGPGIDFFRSIFHTLGEKPIIAEDLGVITPEVVEIRLGVGLWGMRVLQFAFGAFETDATDPYLPHNFVPETVVYTGTHDNDTTASWYATASTKEKENLMAYLDLGLPESVTPGQVAWKMVRLAWSSVAGLAIVPLQDLLGLGNEGRMNLPGQPSGNWRWRYQPGVLSEELKTRLYDITVRFARYVPSS